MMRPVWARVRRVSLRWARRIPKRYLRRLPRRIAVPVLSAASWPRYTTADHREVTVPEPYRLEVYWLRIEDDTGPGLLPVPPVGRDPAGGSASAPSPHIHYNLAESRYRGGRWTTGCTCRRRRWTARSSGPSSSSPTTSRTATASTDDRAVRTRPIDEEAFAVAAAEVGRPAPRWLDARTAPDAADRRAARHRPADRGPAPAARGRGEPGPRADRSRRRWHPTPTSSSSASDPGADLAGASRLAWVHVAPRRPRRRGPRAPSSTGVSSVTCGAGRSARRPGRARPATSSWPSTASTPGSSGRSGGGSGGCRGQGDRRALRGRTVLVVGTGHTGRAVARALCGTRDAGPRPPAAGRAGGRALRAGDQRRSRVRRSTCSWRRPTPSSSLRPSTTASRHLIGARAAGRHAPGRPAGEHGPGRPGRRGRAGRRAAERPARGAATDVVDGEPLAMRSPLWRAPNLLITPHIVTPVGRSGRAGLHHPAGQHRALTGGTRPSTTGSGPTTSTPGRPMRRSRVRGHRWRRWARRLAVSRIGLVGCGRWGRYVLRDLRDLGAEVMVADPSGEDGAVHRCPRPAGRGRRRRGHAGDDPRRGRAARWWTGGCPIFCEKPFTTDVADARDLVALAGGPDPPDARLALPPRHRVPRGARPIGCAGRRCRVSARPGSNGPSPRLDTDPVWTLVPHDLTVAIEVLGHIPGPGGGGRRRRRPAARSLGASAGTIRGW